VNEQVLSKVGYIGRVSSPRCESQAKHTVQHTVVGIKSCCKTRISLLVPRLHELHRRRLHRTSASVNAR
jgi:hypothetical protein